MAAPPNERGISGGCATQREGISGGCATRERRHFGWLRHPTERGFGWLRHPRGRVFVWLCHPTPMGSGGGANRHPGERDRVASPPEGFWWRCHLREGFGDRPPNSFCRVGGGLEPANSGSHCDSAHHCAISVLYDLGGDFPYKPPT